MNRLIMGMILVLGSIYFIGGYYSITSEEASNNTQLKASTGHISETSTPDFRNSVDQNVYSADENGQKYYLQFESENAGWTGSATFTLPDGCEFVYGYTLEKNKIDMNYIGNTCGAEGKDAVMYIKNDGTIATNIHNQKFVFSKN